MKKFSKIKENKVKNKGKIIFDTEYTQIIEFENWNLIQEKDIAICIPYLIEENKFIIRYEYIPTYKYATGEEYHITVLSGSIEKDETPKNAIIREISEEAGIKIKNENILEEYKPLFISKGNVNKYHIFIAPLSKNDYEEVYPTGDGSTEEEKSKSVKISINNIDNLKTCDLITDYALLKLKDYLNLGKI